MIVAAYVLFVVAFTWLATVQWLTLPGEEPAAAAPRGLRAAPSAPQGPDGARDLPAPQRPAAARTAPRWAHTQPLDHEDAA